jgi:hypothetical protein
VPGEAGEYPRPGLYQHDTGLTRINAAKIPRKCGAGELNQRACQLNTGGALPELTEK